MLIVEPFLSIVADIVVTPDFFLDHRIPFGAKAQRFASGTAVNRHLQAFVRPDCFVSVNTLLEEVDQQPRYDIRLLD